MIVRAGDRRGPSDRDRAARTGRDDPWRPKQRSCGRCGGDWKVETIELDPPKTGEVLVRIAASGMCHSDEHLRTGDLGGLYPIIGGHEGAGVVEEVGPEVSRT